MHQNYKVNSIRVRALNPDPHQAALSQAGDPALRDPDHQAIRWVGVFDYSEGAKYPGLARTCKPF